MGDSILHYTAGFLTAYASAIYTLTFLVGIYFAAKFNRGTVAAIALAAVVAGFYVRSGAHPLSAAGITAMIVVHVAGGALVGAWLKGKSAFGYKAPSNKPA